MTNREKLNEAWDSVYYTNDIERRIKDLVPVLVEFLMESLLDQEEIEIGCFYRGKNRGSCVGFDIYNTDKILELHYKQDTSFEIHVAIADEDGDMRSFYSTLTEKHIGIIPEGLRILMKKAYDKDETLVFKPDRIEAH